MTALGRWPGMLGSGDGANCGSVAVARGNASDGAGGAGGALLDGAESATPPEGPTGSMSPPSAGPPRYLRKSSRAARVSRPRPSRGSLVLDHSRQTGSDATPDRQPVGARRAGWTSIPRTTRRLGPRRHARRARPAPPRGATDRARRRQLRDQGAARRPRRTRVPAAARTRRRRPPDRRGRGRADRQAGPGRRHVDHQASRLLPAVPHAARRARPDDPISRRSHARCARRAVGAAPPRRLLLGRLLAVEHPLPARRRRFVGLRDRPRDRRAVSEPDRRPAPARPRHRHRERGGGPARSSDRRSAGGGHRPVGGVDTDRGAVRVAVDRTHRPRRVRRRRNVPDRATPAAAAPARVRRRGDGDRRIP